MSAGKGSQHWIGCLFAGLLASSALAATDACIDCHQDPSLRVKQRRLYEYYQEWTRSPHKEAGVTCSDCHGGDPISASTDLDQAHAGVFLPSDAQSRVYYKNLPQTCGRCHEEVLGHFVTSKHYRELQQKPDAPHCATCHGSMNTKVNFVSVVDATCATCHKERELADVDAQARNILQHLKIARGYLGWTKLQYAGNEEPATVRQLNDRYRRTAQAWHRFDLDASEQDAVALLKDLEAIFRAAWAEKNPGKPLP